MDTKLHSLTNAHMQLGWLPGLDGTASPSALEIVGGKEQER